MKKYTQSYKYKIQINQIKMKFQLIKEKFKKNI